MDRQEIEAKVKEFLIEDLEIDEEKIQPEARLKEFSQFCDYIEQKTA